MSAAAPLKRRVVQGSDESIYGRESWSRQQLYICRQQRSIRDSYPRLRRPAWPCAAHVVALGEPMHGAHEPLAFRNRLFRFLVERMGFTAIALESGFTESISARSFIEGGEGDAETAVRTGLSSGANQYPENRELIQWMRDYNATASSAGYRRIRLYGIDITAGGRK